MNPADFGKVAVLMGGNSAEREISLMSGHGVLNALRARQIDAYAFDPAEQALHTLKSEGYTRCFIALHGPGGEDGSLQGALEYLQIPYTGPGVMASSIAMDKIMTKRVWSSANIPTPPYIVLDAHEQPTEDELTRIVNTLGLPLIVKPPHEGSSLGVSKVTEKAQLAQAIRNARMYEPTVLCESFITGDEYTCAILGEGAQARALPLIRIVAPEGAYDYQNKYFTDVVRYECPCGLTAEEEQRIQSIALNAYRALGCRGWSRIDLMLDNATRQPYLLEANTAPGMTSHSLVPRAAQAVGISYEDLCAQILASASLER